MSRVKRKKSVCYCISLRRASSVVTELYDGFLAPAGLTVTQLSLLINLGQLGTASVSQLAEQVGLERTTLVRTLRPLLEKGLVSDAAPAGQRDRALTLTEAGLAAMEAGDALWEQAQAEIRSRIGPERVEQLNDILTLLLE